MASNAINMLLRYEEMVLSGKIKSFVVQIREKGIAVRPGGAGPEQLVPLSPKVLRTLQTYFYDVKSFAHGSPDYTTLKSLINARDCMERIVRNAKV